MVDDSENTDVETEITVHDDTSDSNSFQEQSGTQEQWDSEDCSDSWWPLTATTTALSL